MIWIAIGLALFFAMNIGASGTAASMGAAYGSGAVRNKRKAMILVACGALLGAVVGGEEVVKTIGGGIVPSALFDINTVAIVLASSTLTLFAANLLGIPLSTSEVTVGSIVGIGIACKSLFFPTLLKIVAFWIFVPLTALILAFLLGKGILMAEDKWPQLKGEGAWRNWLGRLLVCCGVYEAFSAGMNNVANAMGPLIGAGVLQMKTGIWIGGLAVALGAVVLGGKVLETNGKKITSLSLLQGSAVSATGGTLVVIASVLGMPVPLTQATTCAILGIGVAKNGFSLWQKGIIRQIIMVWLVSPVSSLVVSFALYHLLLSSDLYVVIVMFSVFVSTAGLIHLTNLVRREKESFHDQGGGI